ncbi:hypothetical protein C5167_034413 [Papaver somniferum]|uniref:Large ribosomal subunit protein uL30 N-terminal eukaryotes domain-containing protein n=1 Tax=Papaver somniferum TaxID=3469 RepID=A0A4Y7KCX5_PAPSO|nr:hypothetical protein C5167_034413 [Papaver somniferum]
MIYREEMATEVKARPMVPESFLKKQKRSEEWELAKKQELEAAKKKNTENRKLIFNRAKQYAREYSEKQRELINLKCEAKLRGGFYFNSESKLLFYRSNQGGLGKYGIICIEDLIHEIMTVGPHFK